MTSLDTFNGTFKIYDNTTDVTTGYGAVFSVAHQDGCTVTINSSTGVYQVSAVQNDNANATFRANYNGNDIYRSFTISKARPTDGTSKYVELSTSHYFYGYLANNQVKSQTTTLSVAKFNLAADPQWRIKRVDDTVIAEGHASDLFASQHISGANNANTITIEAALFDQLCRNNGVTAIIIEAVVQNGETICSDRVTLYQLLKRSRTTWDSVDDPDGTKPENNATYGAPDGSPVGALTAEQVVAALTTDEGDLLRLKELLDDIAAADQLIQDIEEQINIDLAAVQGEVTAIQQDMSDLQTQVSEDIQEINEEIAGINPMATPNLLENGGFENGIADWSGTGGWNVSSGADWGPYAWNNVNVADGGWTNLWKTVPNIVVGREYTFSADVGQFIANGSGSHVLEIQWMNSANQIISSSYGATRASGPDFTVADTARKELKATGVAPAGTIYARGVISWFKASGTIASCHARRAKFELGNKATAFTSEASAYTAYQTAKAANGSVATLTSTVTTMGGSVTTQGQSITKLQDAAANVTGNLLTNTDFALDANGWIIGGGLTGATMGRNLIGDAWRPYNESVLCISQPNGATGGYQDAYQEVPIVAGKWYEVSVLLSTHRCQGELFLQWIDASGNGLGAPSSGASDVGGKGQNIADWNGRTVKGQAPAGAVKGRIILRKHGTNAGASPADSHALFCRPQLVQTTQDAALVPYSPGSGKAGIQSVSSSLSTLSNVVTASSNPNLLSNGSFENGLRGWSVIGGPAGNWYQQRWAWGTYAANTTAWTGASGANHRYLQSDLIALAGDGNVYTLAGECEMSGGAAARSYMEINWYNGSGGFISQASTPFQGPTGFTNNGAQRSLNKATLVSPAGATSAKVNLVVYAPDGVTVNVMCWRQVKLEFGSIATSYSGEATAAQMFSAYSTLNESYASLNTEVNSAGGRVQTALNSASNANNNISSLENRLVAGNPNLITNGSAEYGLTDWYSGYGNWATIAQSNLWGSYFYVLGTGPSGDKWYYLNHNNVPVSPNTWYTFTCDVDLYASAPSGQAYLEMIFLNSSGGVLAQPASPTRVYANRSFQTDGLNRKQIKLTAASPEGTTQMFVRVVVFTPNGVDLNSFAFRQAKLEVGEAITGYSGEASATQAFTTLSSHTTSLSSLNYDVYTNGGRVHQALTAASTANGDIASLKQKVTTGSGNLLPQSDFVRDTSWYGTWVPYSGYTLVRDLAGDDWRPLDEHTIGIVQAGANQGEVADWNVAVGIEAGKWYEFSAHAATHRCNSELGIDWRNSADQSLGVSWGGSVDPLDGGRYIANWSRLWVKGQAPSGAVRAVCFFRKYSTWAGHGDSYAWWTRPMLREVTAEFVGPSSYTPTGNRATLESFNTSVNGVLAKSGVRLDVNGYVTGWETNNNGSSGNFTINSDYFSIVKPGGGARTEYSNGNWRVYDANGVLRVRLGVW